MSVIHGKAVRITPLIRSRRVRVTQLDESGNALSEHSFPIAKGVARVEYTVADEWNPDVSRQLFSALNDVILKP
jgi:hypothetical protein